MKLIALVSMIIFAPLAWPCATKSAGLSKNTWVKFKRLYEIPRSARKPSSAARPPLLPTDWGGTDTARWRPESVLANSASLALNDAWSLDDVKDVIVAIPLKFSDSGFHPYGDGQSNAQPSFGDSWPQKRPQIVATLIKFRSQGSKIKFRIDRNLLKTAQDLEIAYKQGANLTKTTIPLQKESETGDFVGEWGQVPSNPDTGILVRPSPSYHDWFVIFFRHPVNTTDGFLQNMPGSKTHFTGNMASLTLVNPSTKKYQDPMGIGEKASGALSVTPFQLLMNTKFPLGYNSHSPEPSIPYTPDNIHGRFGKDGPVTAVGQGWTWVVEDQQSRPFKIMYTCFQRRQPDAEGKAPNGGVPSGGGWHSINNKTPGVDPDVPEKNATEIIVNSLERVPLVVAGGYTQVLARSGLTNALGANESLSYGLTDVATIRWLWPGEGFITTAGTSFQNLHWYFFQQEREVCTEEWVGQCGVDFPCQ